MNDETPKLATDQASQPRCMDMLNDESEGHYWSWVNAPQSIPNQFRECMSCGRIDATDWLAARDQQIALEAQEKIDDRLQFAIDVITQYGYVISPGVYSTGGMSTQEWAFSILKEHGILDKKGRFNTLKSKQKGTTNDK